MLCVCLRYSLRCANFSVNSQCEYAIERTMPMRYTPFVKQCILTVGFSLNMSAATLLMAYSSGLSLQLKQSDSEIPINTAMESWIAAAPCASGLLGGCITAYTMARLGRRLSQIMSVLFLIIGWVALIFARGVTVILLGRFFHGLAMGSSILITPIIASEWCSPRLRGATMMFTNVMSGTFGLLSHTTALYLHWRTNAIIGAAIAVVILPIAIYSPETPSWLALQQKYDECKRVFRWLRGDDEEDELAKIIAASEKAQKLKIEMSKLKSETSIIQKMKEQANTVTKRDFYKPIVLIMHVYIAGQWCSSHLFNNYIFSLMENVVGFGYNDQVMGININRLLGGILSTYTITKAKRRTMYFSFAGVNAVTLVAIAIYTYAKDVTSFESPILGLFLLHILMLCVTSCTLPMPYLIASEIFPLKYKSIASGFGLSFILVNCGVFIKTYPYIVNTLNIYGAFTIYAGIFTYSLVILYLYLPETKDKTLLEIEEELIGKPTTLEDLKSVQSLLNIPDYNEDVKART